jgi:predicted DNA-binding protein
MARSDPQVNIRMPQELKDRLEIATGATNRSLNGEIVERLERSFEGPVKQSEVEDLLRALSERDERAGKIAARDHLISLTAVFLRLVIERLPKGADEISNRLMGMAQKYANHVVHGDLDGAVKVAVELVDLGVQFGVLHGDESGEVMFGPDPAAGRKLRSSPMAFPDAFERPPPPPGKMSHKGK